MDVVSFAVSYSLCLCLGELHVLPLCQYAVGRCTQWEVSYSESSEKVTHGLTNQLTTCAQTIMQPIPKV